MRLKKHFSALLALFLLAQLCLTPIVKAQDNVIITAMNKELVRSLARLKAIKETPVYFLGYTIYDTESLHLTSQYGALNVDAQPKHTRVLDIDMRVGSPDLDNTHKVRDSHLNYSSLSSQALVSIPIENDELALRAAIWIRTENAFKVAQKQFTVVKANQDLQAPEEDMSSDFSLEKPCVYSGESKTLKVDRLAWEAKLRRLSAIYKSNPHILHSLVDFNATKTHRYLVNSEGTKVQDESLHYRLSTTAEVVAADGMRLWLYDSAEAPAIEELPSEEQFAKTIHTLADSLEQLRTAPLAEPYTGPAILNSKAAGVYFHETLGHRVEGNRQKDMEDGRTFAKKLGQAIMPDFISVVDDPTTAQLKSKSLNGSYKIDDEGVPAQKVTIVDHGVLKTFLTDRSPVKNCPHSNGHGRCSPGYAPIARQGNLMIIADKSISYNELKIALIKEAKNQGKPYGLVFDQIAGGFTFTQTATPQTFKLMPLLVKRVYVDGRPDELIRGVDLVGTPLLSLESILLAADDVDTFNGTCGAKSGWVPVSASSPSLLIKTIEVERKANTQEKLPILPAPITENKK